MSTLGECRLLVEDSCRELRDSFDDIDLDDTQKTIVARIKNETLEITPDTKEMFRLLKKAGLHEDYDAEDDEMYETYHYQLIDDLCIRMMNLAAAERSELQLLQQEAKASSGLPSNASCH